MVSFPQGKRYFPLDAHYRQVFGKKMCRLPVNAGFTCPNRDGSKGVGGCRFCSGVGSGEFAGAPSLSVARQLEEGKRLFAAKWPDAGYLAYFQAFTNTYAPLSRLESVFFEALDYPGVEGLVIATRADCITPEVVSLLRRLQKRCYLSVELGLQTVHDVTAHRMNRGHSYEEFLTGLSLLQEGGIRVCVHLINGLPGETPDMMRESAAKVAQLSVDGIKLHMLYLTDDTPLLTDYKKGQFSLLSREEYVGIVCDQLELLSPKTVVERLTGDGDRRKNPLPEWSRAKRSVLAGIDRELARRNSFQGKRFPCFEKRG